MPKFRKIPVVIEAEEFHKQGDAGVTEMCAPNDYRHCEHCNKHLRLHGIIKTLEGQFTVCPGDWIVTGVKKERYAVKPDIFQMTYEPVR